MRDGGPAAPGHGGTGGRAGRRGVRRAGGADALATRQRLEMLGGFVGFFTLIALANAVGLIVSGRPSVWASLVLVLMLALSWYTYRGWRRADRLVKGG